MTDFLLHHIIRDQAALRPDATAIKLKSASTSYAALWAEVQSFAAGLLQLGLQPNERVGVLLPKQFETVNSFFGAAAAAGVFVPLNPVLKAPQVGYILRDCNVRVLVTTAERAALLADELPHCPDLRSLVITSGDRSKIPGHLELTIHDWAECQAEPAELPGRIDADMTAILYTSGSTGKPKGVVLSHRNMFAGAQSVSTYLQNTADDRLLAVLPFSFDYGLSQLTTAFYVGAQVVLMDYLLPRDVIRACAREQITGLAAVPPLWNQLAELDWPAEAAESLRYFTNSGGAMPRNTLDALRRALPKAKPYLMYGLTEAFRSTYLPPELVDAHPDSMGRAIPNAEVMVVREDGSECAPGEPGELVHRGALVALGYWNDREKTDERFKPAPGQPEGLPNPELAVWSGDQVRRDDNGLLYFISRKDEMIKTSGYRVSPTEVEEIVYGAGEIAQVAALGLPHPTLGQAILTLVQPNDPQLTEQQILIHCKQNMPNYMVPAAILLREQLPRNANGKLDRSSLKAELKDFFTETTR